MNHWTCKLLGAGLLMGSWGLCQGTPLAEVSLRAVQTAAWVPVPDEVLGSARGGFQLDTELRVSFGFVRSVSINGDLVHSTRFTLPDLSRITELQAQVVSAALAEAGLVQVGTGNSIAPAVIAQIPTGTVIQNTLNNQAIQSLTVINAGVNSQSILKSINIQGILNDALMGVLTRY